MMHSDKIARAIEDKDNEFTVTRIEDDSSVQTKAFNVYHKLKVIFEDKLKEIEKVEHNMTKEKTIN